MPERQKVTRHTAAVRRGAPHAWVIGDMPSMSYQPSVETAMLVPDRLCRLITGRTEGCMIMGLGWGPDAHGQVQIHHDAFGLYPRFRPRMAKVFADAGAVIREGLAAYVEEVTARMFPAPEHGFTMQDEEYDELVRGLADPDGGG